jgi:hypothetical protein
MEIVRVARGGRGSMKVVCDVAQKPDQLHAVAISVDDALTTTSAWVGSRKEEPFVGSSFIHSANGEQTKVQHGCYQRHD